MNWTLDTYFYLIRYEKKNVGAKMFLRTVLSLSLIIFVLQSHGKLLGESSIKKTLALELFSSESCDSCPPADRWLSSLKSDEALFRDYVPLAFHVDYWNYLHWKDKFSSGRMTQRQRNHAATWKKPSVYTPGLILDGQEWRAWRSQKTPSIPSLRRSDVGVLSLKQKSKSSFELQFRPMTKKTKGYQGHIAILGFDISTEVTSGENAGKTLMHDFLVLEWVSAKMGEDNKVELKLDGSKYKDKKLGYAAWVEEAGNQAPVQILGGYF